MKLHEHINAGIRHSSNKFLIHSDTDVENIWDTFIRLKAVLFLCVCLAVGFMPYSAIYDLSFQPLFGKC